MYASDENTLQKLRFNFNLSTQCWVAPPASNYSRFRVLALSSRLVHSNCNCCRRSLASHAATPAPAAHPASRATPCWCSDTTLDSPSSSSQARIQLGVSRRARSACTGSSSDCSGTCSSETRLRRGAGTARTTPHSTARRAKARRRSPLEHPRQEHCGSSSTYFFYFNFNFYPIDWFFNSPTTCLTISRKN